MTLSSLRKRIQTMNHADEHSCIIRMRHMSSLSKQARDNIVHRARTLTTQCREDTKGSGALDAFLLEFGLSNKEGVALMCLAEALLRVPDALTCDRLIAEKIQSGQWHEHSGNSNSLFVNASTWGLMLTGQVVSLDESITQKPTHWVKNLVSHVGEPVVRLAMQQAMRIMGGQYVLGRTITEAMTRGKEINSISTRFSFDMLGEGARTDRDAQNYFDAYSKAIDAIGEAEEASDVYNANGISVKLSALHPRYHFSHQHTVMSELLPRIKALCIQAKRHNIGLSIDAEEAERLDISLDIFEHLARDEELAHWDGLGFVLQAYQKRSPFVAQWLIQLAHDTDRRLMVRLVKGAYWDAEIKQAQEQGLTDYPVYTRKANTDLSYQYCAEVLLDAQENIYPQFATHNAYTVALILELAGNKAFEFQRLHGMGDLLYRHLKSDDAGQHAPIRVYAPVGKHKDLLPYLVRRLLENGANSSFVNRFLDNQTPVETLIKDVDTQVTEVFPHCHKNIVTPQHIYQDKSHKERSRFNSKGIDLNSPVDTATLLAAIDQTKKKRFEAAPIINGETKSSEKYPVKNPADHSHIVGFVSEPSAQDIEQALESANQAFSQWNDQTGTARATILESTANRFEQCFNEMTALISLEAGRTLDDAVSEVREAIDFCRYYANHAKQYCDGPSSRQGLGVFLCISPWNFPLAIFTGQIAAALAAGNTVIAKPAEQTPLIASLAVTLLHQAGVPQEALQYLPGHGARIGKQLITDTRISGVCFTGSTDTALLINKQLANRPGPTAPLIAETGGQNAMIVDSTALPEQVVDDTISSAFLSAGQRCSALRVLFLQNDIADTVIEMLKGAMRSLTMGDPARLSTDIGPVIDNKAKDILVKHVEAMHKQATFITAVEAPDLLNNGSFFPPHIFELNSLSQLPKEVFGPILHIIRYDAKDLPNVIQQINDSGYGLTLGIHSRIEMVADYIYRNTHVGNTYINRNTVGAVVGVNPFGGQGLSGTGPKAGGPNYLLRFTRSAQQVVNTTPDTAVSTTTNISTTTHQDTAANSTPNTTSTAVPSNIIDSMPIAFDNALEKATSAHKQWTTTTVGERADYLLRASSFLHAQLAAQNDQQSDNSPRTLALSDSANYCHYFSVLAHQYLLNPILLPGPTGEENTLSLHGRGIVICIASKESPLQNITLQVCLALASGCSVIVTTNHSDTKDPSRHKLLTAFQQSGLPNGVLQWISESAINKTLLDKRVKLVSVCSSAYEQCQSIRNIIVQREGEIIPLIEIPNSVDTENSIEGYALLTRFSHEKTKTDNLVAKGGNTQLFNLAE